MHQWVKACREAIKSQDALFKRLISKCFRCFFPSYRMGSQIQKPGNSWKYLKELFWEETKKQQLYQQDMSRFPGISRLKIFRCASRISSKNFPAQRLVCELGLLPLEPSRKEWEKRTNRNRKKEKNVDFQWFQHPNFFDIVLICCSHGESLRRMIVSMSLVVKT